ncbi:UvrD-helicase domain-containing protein [Aquimarina longa]|uniref:UvrD-helicase domain-containing protein n=1 Tax=Aquimarina longa TaxID=1080221 RepID=UPI00078575F2|nr:UvrD-helicase domain-containing protein [Aquimarina longa]
MNPDTAFTVYNAAAGAGKTYTLVKAYLIALLKGEFKDSYKNILAITFTNKAVAEMKTRILENLVAISKQNTPLKYQSLLKELVVAIKVPEKELKQKAKRILKSILHNYAAFDVVTIDTFTHRVIRTFAYDLGIPMNFEIEMNTDALIEEAVDAVIAKIGLNQELTRLIIDFAISKLEDDKSWDITIELNKIAKLLFSENDREHLNKLSEKETSDFEELKKILHKKITDLKHIIKDSSQKILNQIHSLGLDHKDFSRGTIPNHFQKLCDGVTKFDFKKTKWAQNIETTSFYTKTLENTKKESIDSIRPEIEEAFVTTKTQLSQLTLFNNILKNITPLSVLNAINKEVLEIKKERKILLISEFNAIISEAIQGQPAPFIYERLGERYRDYFVDEFQDTSELQWNNLVPLIDNAVSTETLAGKRGKVTIVGDAKQAIYRWRGGKAEQFIDLSSDKDPFSIQEKQVLNLPKNYRSHEEVVKFNNSLFTFLSGDFSDEKHQKLYLEGNRQEINSKKNGYVNVSFIKAKNVAVENELYPEKTYETIIELNNKGYALNEICIIVRKRKEGVVIADFLTQKGLAIISSETLLINNAPQVRFIINLLTWSIQPDHLQSKINVLHFLTEQFSVEEKHIFLQKMMDNTTKTFFSSELETLGISFSFSELAVKPLYDAVEYIISTFSLADKAIAYVQFFLDVVFTFTQRYIEGVVGFLAYWHAHKDKLSIIAPKAEGAIQIITIHKAKGLEFPCVIYPYADIDMYEEIEPKTWLSVVKEDYANFEEVFINYNKNISEYSDATKEIVLNRQSQLELDAFNLLYVVLTRAKEQLYILSNLKLNSKEESNPHKFSGKLIAYLKHLGQWNLEKITYDFGNPIKPDIISTDAEEKLKIISLSRFEDASKKYKVNIVTNSGKLWDTSQQSAIEKGNLIHDLMASIETHSDVEKVIQEAHDIGKVSSSEKEIFYNEIKRIVDHPKLSQYFSIDNKIYNERDIISNGKLFRPDRIVIDKNNIITIIDYKTGVYDISHAIQIQKYRSLLEDIGYVVKNTILLYSNEEISLMYI